MTTRSPESTHEAEPNRAQPKRAVESPSADRMTGANGPSVELPGDTNSADIVGRTGEEMPLQSHDGVDAETPRAVKNDTQPPVRADDDNAGGTVAD